MTESLLFDVIKTILIMVAGAGGTLLYYNVRKKLLTLQVRKEKLDLIVQERQNYEQLRKDLAESRKQTNESLSALSALQRWLINHNHAIRVLVDNCDCPEESPEIVKIKADLADEQSMYHVDFSDNG